MFTVRVATKSVEVYSINCVFFVTGKSWLTKKLQGNFPGTYLENVGPIK